MHASPVWTLLTQRRDDSDSSIPHSTEPLAALNFASASTDSFTRLNNPVFQRLMVSLGMIMFKVLPNGRSRQSLATNTFEKN